MLFILFTPLAVGFFTLSTHLYQSHVTYNLFSTEPEIDKRKFHICNWIANHNVSLKGLYQQLYRVGYRGPTTTTQTNYFRTLGEAESLGSLLFLLFQSLISRQSELSLLNKQWEYEFAVMLSEQYSCTIWLRSLILVLKKIGTSVEDKFKQMQVAMQFVADKLRDPEISYKLQLKEDMHDIQNMVGELMEQVVYHLQLVDANKKHSLKENIRAVLRTLTKGLPPSTYFNVIKELINHGDSDMKKKGFCPRL
ncbi:hypothetical protein ACP275_06G119200 [Erythranthe tilingii]